MKVYDQIEEFSQECLRYLSEQRLHPSGLTSQLDAFLAQEDKLICLDGEMNGLRAGLLHSPCGGNYTVIGLRDEYKKHVIIVWMMILPVKADTASLHLCDDKYLRLAILATVKIIRDWKSSLGTSKPLRV